MQMRTIIFSMLAFGALAGTGESNAQPWKPTRSVEIIVGPKGMTAPQIAYWDGVFAKLAQMPEWRDELARLLQDPVYLNSRDTQKYLDAQHQELRAALVDLGLVK